MKTNPITGESTVGYSFKYLLPSEQNGKIVPVPVCGNAFAFAYDIGKNTRTAFEKVAREELLGLAATVTNRHLR